jgi:protocatechuate 3,4-dioxygenase beta subunit
VVRALSPVRVAVVTTLSLGALLAAYAPAALAVGQALQTRDPAAPPAAPQRDPTQPTVRRIPVGTATISGTVVAADTGRPVRNARVNLSGTAGSAGARAGGASGGLTPGISNGVTGATAAGAASGRGAGTVQVVYAVVQTGVSRSTTTDAQRLPAGQFTLNANQSQFLAASYGQRRPGGQGTAIQLVDGQQMKVKLPMMSGGVITGMVFGEDGETLRNVQIRTWRYALVNGFRRLQAVGYASTDDRGIYRIYNLQPGEYLVAATPNMSDFQTNERMNAESVLIEQAIASGAVLPPTAPGMPATVAVSIPAPTAPSTGSQGPPSAYLPTYAPGTLVPSGASSVQVTGGDERAGVDIRVVLAQASTVQGMITTPLDPGVAVQVSLVNNDPMMDGISQNSARADQQGRFTFRAVPPGTYVVHAQTVPAPPTMTFVNGMSQPLPPGPAPRLTDAQKLWGRATVTVEGQSTADVNISLQEGRSISGQLLYDMARMPDLSRVRPTVSLNIAPMAQGIVASAPMPVQVGPDGRFTISGVMPGRYTLRSSVGTMKSAMVGGEDTLDFPLDFAADRDITDAVLTVTDKTTELGGALTDATGKPAVDYTIIAAPADPRYWTPGSRRVVTTRPATDGRYLFRTLPPGEYLVAALTDLESGGQYDPELLKQLAAASVRITILEGGRVAQDLRVQR